MRTYLEQSQRDIRYLDLGASLGGSRKMIEGLVRKAEPAAAAQEQLVLGLSTFRTPQAARVQRGWQGYVLTPRLAVSGVSWG